MRCDHCKPVDFQMLARGESDLVAVLTTVRQAVDSGAVVYDATASEHALSGQPSFLDLDLSRPWPDVLDYRFCCPSCGRRFRLSAETYHGSTAVWKRV